jgi:hypothetical protein
MESGVVTREIRHSLFALIDLSIFVRVDGICCATAVTEQERHVGLGGRSNGNHSTIRTCCESRPSILACRQRKEFPDGKSPAT